MNRTRKIGAAVAGGSVAALAAAAVVMAMPAPADPAADSTTNPTSTVQSETPLTGDDASKATAAAKAAVPGGTVLRVETDSDGVYEAHMQKSDGSQVVVKTDSTFKVTSVDSFGGGSGDSGHGAGETLLTGDDAARATAAANTVVTGGTILRVETDSEGVYEAHIMKSDGSQVVVKMDSSFKITSVDAFGGGHGGPGHTGGPDSDSASPSGATASPSA